MNIWKKTEMKNYKEKIERNKKNSRKTVENTMRKERKLVENKKESKKNKRLKQHKDTREGKAT